MLQFSLWCITKPFSHDFELAETKISMFNLKYTIKQAWNGKDIAKQTLDQGQTIIFRNCLNVDLTNLDVNPQLHHINPKKPLFDVSIFSIILYMSVVLAQ